MSLLWIYDSSDTYLPRVWDMSAQVFAGSDLHVRIELFFLAFEPLPIRKLRLVL